MSHSRHDPIRLDDLLAELEALGDSGGDGDLGWTAGELERIWNIHRRRVLGVLAEAKAQGLLIVSRKRSEAVDGRVVTRPAYRIRRDTNSQGGETDDDDV